jgi:hypothetical protein
VPQHLCIKLVSHSLPTCFTFPIPFIYNKVTSAIHPFSSPGLFLSFVPKEHYYHFISPHVCPLYSGTCYNPSTREAEAGGSQVQGLVWCGKSDRVIQKKSISSNVPFPLPATVSRVLALAGHPAGPLLGTNKN